jgi:hypothetical protein
MSEEEEEEPIKPFPGFMFEYKARSSWLAPMRFKILLYFLVSGLSCSLLKELILDACLKSFFLDF